MDFIHDWRCLFTVFGRNWKSTYKPRVESAFQPQMTRKQQNIKAWFLLATHEPQQTLFVPGPTLYQIQKTCAKNKAASESEHNPSRQQFCTQTQPPAAPLTSWSMVSVSDNSVAFLSMSTHLISNFRLTGWVIFIRVTSKGCINKQINKFHPSV